MTAHEEATSERGAPLSHTHREDKYLAAAIDLEIWMREHVLGRKIKMRYGDTRRGGAGGGGAVQSAERGKRKRRRENGRRVFGERGKEAQKLKAHNCAHL